MNNLKNDYEKFWYLTGLIKSGETIISTVLCILYDIDVNFCPNGCDSLLNTALIFYNYELVKFLLSKGADVTKRSSFDILPIDIALGSGDRKLIFSLVEYGVVIDKRINKGDVKRGLQEQFRSALRKEKREL